MKFNTVPCRIVILQESDNGYRIGSPPPPTESNQNCTHRTGYPIPMPLCVLDRRVWGPNWGCLIFTG